MKKLVYIITLLFAFQAKSLCQIYNSNGSPASIQNDAHFLILSGLPNCPEDVIEYKNQLLKLRLSSKPTMVANRGKNNSHLGSFSFFEQVTGVLNGTLKVAVAEGEFFFGHFTKKVNNQIDLDQAKNKGQLLIELIAWDYAKQLFNFYELIGTGGSAKWFYRGDSKDILFDNQFLYRTSTPQFGRTLRCSACHASGGPIMKELSAPHNDWWTKQRPLSFGNAALSSQIKMALNNIQDASTLSHAVQTASLKLQASPAYQQIKSRESLQEQLRPLFCDTEINIESSPVGLNKILEV